MKTLISKNHLSTRLAHISGLIIAATLSACGSDAPSAVTPVPIAIEQPKATTETYSMLRQHGVTNNAKLIHFHN